MGKKTPTPVEVITEAAIHGLIPYDVLAYTRHDFTQWNKAHGRIRGNVLKSKAARTLLAGIRKRIRAQIRYRNAVHIPQVNHTPRAPPDGQHSETQPDTAPSVQRDPNSLTDAQPIPLHMLFATPDSNHCAELPFPPAYTYY